MVKAPEKPDLYVRLKVSAAMSNKVPGQPIECPNGGWCTKFCRRYDANFLGVEPQTDTKCTNEVRKFN